MSDFEMQRTIFGSFYSVKTIYCAVLFFLMKHDFELKERQRVRFRIATKWKALDFELEIFRHVRFRINFFSSCQTLN